jgi:hypothetical protein
VLHHHDTEEAEEGEEKGARPVSGLDSVMKSLSVTDA